MFDSIKNNYSMWKSCVNEAFSSETNHKFNILISSIPVVGLIFIINKEYTASTRLLSAIKNKDIPKSIELINAKNCYKIYFTIHFLVLGILAISVNGFHGVVPLAALIASIPIINMYKSHKIIDKIQKLNYSFVVIDYHSSLSLPQMRCSSWVSKIIPWIECGLRNNLTNKVSFVTIY